jgi:copper transport outer membrane protein MctB
LIDFRYHLVSIVAVFLALAIGLVIGGIALQPSVVATLNRQSKHELQANEKLNHQNNLLNKQLAADNAFAQAAASTLLPGRLQGQSVVLVEAPGADSGTVTGMTAAIGKAGGTVTGQVLLSQQFFDTAALTETALKATAVQAEGIVPPGVRLPTTQAATQIAGQQAAAQVIAAAIVDKYGLPTMSAAESQAILAKFGQQNFLSISGPNGAAALAGQATMAVVVLPAAVPTQPASGPDSQALVSLTRDLQQISKGAIMAGTFGGSGAGSAIEYVTNGGAGAPLTTVDNADTEIGQIIVVQALNELLHPHATPASYGARAGTVPSPAPSPLPSPSVSTSPAKKKA